MNDAGICAVCARRRADYVARRPLTAGDLTIDLRRCEVLCRGERVPLTPTEYRLLVQLAHRAGAVVPFAELAEALSEGMKVADAYNALKVHTGRLRRRLAEADSRAVVASVRGFGFLLEVSGCGG